MNRAGGVTPSFVFCSILIGGCPQAPLSPVDRSGTWTGSGTCLLTTFNIDDGTATENEYQEDFEVAVNHDGFPPLGSPFRTIEAFGLTWTALADRNEAGSEGVLVGEILYVGDIEMPTARGGLSRLLRYDGANAMSYREEWGVQLPDPETSAAIEHMLVCLATLTRR